MESYRRREGKAEIHSAQDALASEAAGSRSRRLERALRFRLELKPGGDRERRTPLQVHFVNDLARTHALTHQDEHTSGVRLVIRAGHKQAHPDDTRQQCRHTASSSNVYSDGSGAESRGFRFVGHKLTESYGWTTTEDDKEPVHAATARLRP